MPSMTDGAQRVATGRGVSVPARRYALPGQRPVATYRLDFARGRFDTFVTRAPSVANSFELVTDGDLLFVTFAP